MNQFHNLAAEAPVDDLGALQAEITALQEREKAFKAELKARGVTKLAGERFKVDVGEDAIVWSLDRAKLEAAFGDLTAYSKMGKRAGAVRVTPIRAKLAEAA